MKTTPFFDSNVLATLPSYASKHGLKSIADLKGLGRSVKLGAPPEFATRFEGLPGIKQEYGVNPTFVPIAIELSYKALEGGQVDVQNVFTTDGQLLGGKFTLLADPKHVFGYQNVAPVVRRSVLAAEGLQARPVLVGDVYPGRWGRVGLRGPIAERDLPVGAGVGSLGCGRSQKPGCH